MTDPLKDAAEIRDALIVQLKFISVDSDGTVRVATNAARLDRSQSHDHNCLRLEQEAHRLAVLMVAELESGGWKKRPKKMYGEPGFPYRKPQVDDQDPTSGEGSPL